MLDCTRRLGQELAANSTSNVQVFAPTDAFAADDLPLWTPVPVRLSEVRGPRQFAFAPALRSSLWDFNPDVVHTHGLWTYLSLLAHGWQSSTGRPVVVSSQGMLDPWALSHSRLKKRIAWVLYEHRHLRNASCLHAVAEAEVNAFRSCGLGNPICVIPNAVDLPPDSAGGEAEPWLAQVSPGSKILLFLGRIHPKKGLSPLLQGWAAIRESADGAKGNEWHLVVAGWDQGGHEAGLKAQAEALGIADSVSFIGPLFGEARNVAYRHADAFVLPSHGEGLPLTVLEAWSHKLPVIMTSQCNIPEGFRADAAIPAEPNRDSLAQAMSVLFAMPDAARDAMGRRGFDLVSQEFTWKKAAAEMKSVYDWLLDKGDRPECVVTC
jgi:glycosyltransferase involved in cell wall biosynthesis